MAAEIRGLGKWKGCVVYIKSNEYQSTPKIKIFFYFLFFIFFILEYLQSALEGYK